MNALIITTGGIFESLEKESFNRFYQDGMVVYTPMVEADSFTFPVVLRELDSSVESRIKPIEWKRIIIDGVPAWRTFLPDNFEFSYRKRY